MRRPIVALNPPRRLNDLVAYAQFVADRMKNNPFFPAPPLPISVLDAHVAALRVAQSETLTRAKGTASERDARLAQVLLDLRALRGYVQGLAEFTPGNAAEIVLGSGMYLKRPGLSDKPELAVKPGPSSGTVKVVAKAAGDRASYEWQYATDVGDWIDLLPTRQARTALCGLSPGSVYRFRFRSLTKTGLGDWSQVVSARTD